MHAPASPFYSDPIDDAPLCSQDLEESVQAVITYQDVLTSTQRERLLRALQEHEPLEPFEAVTYGADFDLAGEVRDQIVAVRAMRNFVLDAAGQVKEGVSIREVREAVTANSTLLTGLMKFHETVVNLDRMRSLEKAVVDTLLEVDPELRAAVMERLEERLEHVH